MSALSLAPRLGALPLMATLAPASLARVETADSGISISGEQCK